jgi:hypothetical protein
MAMDTDRPARAASAGRRPRWLRTAKNSLARPPRGTAGPPVGGSFGPRPVRAPGIPRRRAGRWLAPPPR